MFEVNYIRGKCKAKKSTLVSGNASDEKIFTGALAIKKNSINLNNFLK